MTLTPKQASLCLILMNKSRHSGIRPGLHTGQDAEALVEQLRQAAGEYEALTHGLEYEGKEQ